MSSHWPSFLPCCVGSMARVVMCASSRMAHRQPMPSRVSGCVPGAVGSPAAISRFWVVFKAVFLAGVLVRVGSCWILAFRALWVDALTITNRSLQSLSSSR